MAYQNEDPHLYRMQREAMENNLSPYVLPVVLCCVVLALGLVAWGLA
jgi:hypothetical protein